MINYHFTVMFKCDLAIIMMSDVQYTSTCSTGKAKELFFIISLLYPLTEKD